MNSSRRWLIIFAAIIGVLVVAAISLVLFTKDNEADLLPENTPQGIVQRFLIAVQDKDYLKAYNYLSIDSDGKFITYDEWVMQIYHYQSAWKATLGQVTENGDSATVEVTIESFNQGAPFGNSVYSRQVIFQLIYKDGSWLIVSPNYLYWLY
jgi:hypothetical protein